MSNFQSRLLYASAALTLAACGVAVPETDLPAVPPASTIPAAEPTSTSAPPVPEDTPTARVALTSISDVTIPGADGLTLIGTFTPGSGPATPAVLLLHMYGTDRLTWKALANALAQAGMASLAIDLRGHGQTGGAENWALARADVEAAFAWLQGQPGIDPMRVGVSGASIGANLALVQAAKHSDQVAAAAMLSPGLDYFRVKITGLTAEAAQVPLYLAAAEADGYSAETVRTLADQSPSNTTLVVFDGSAHGTEMFFSHPGLIEALVEFFEANLAG